MNSKQVTIDNVTIDMELSHECRVPRYIILTIAGITLHASYWEVKDLLNALGSTFTLIKAERIKRKMMV